MNYKINVSYTAESSGKKIEDFFYIAGEDDLLGDVDYIKETYCQVKDYYSTLAQAMQMSAPDGARQCDSRPAVRVLQQLEMLIVLERCVRTAPAPATA